MHAGENLHRRGARIIADELFVDFENAFQFAVENLTIDVREIEIDHRLAVDSEVMFVHDFMDGTRSHIARHEISVLRIPLLQKIPAIIFRNRIRIALVAGGLRNPDASALAAGGFRHQAQLVFTRNRSGMNLDELAIRVVAALLVQSRLRRSGADNGVGGLSEDRANAASGDDDRIGRKGAHFHAAQIHGADAAANAVAVEHGGEKFPVLVLCNFAFGFVTAHLLIERVKKLLAGGGASEGGAVVKRASKTTEIEQAFGSAIEGHAHAVEQVDNCRCRIAHSFDRWLVGQKIAAVNRVVEVLPGGVAFAFQILGSIDAALCANRMRTLDRNNGEQIDVAAHLGDLDHGCQSSQSAAHDYDFRV